MGLALCIALALSFDGLGVGMAYGIKGIRIPLGSMCIIGLCTALAMASSMMLGSFLAFEFSIISTNFLGATILIVLGIYHLFSSVRNHRIAKSIPANASSDYKVSTGEMLFSIDLRIFGLVIQVLRTPDTADLDKSGSINYKESILLGMALALDSFAAGIAASMAGITLFVIVFVAVMQILMIKTGNFLTGRLPMEVLNKLKTVPGLVLLLIGLLKII